MKVLFAMGNDQVSTNVANRYYEKYGEVLEYKNVFFFKALIEEVKKDKTYDRIIISEELEQFRAKDLEQVDRYLFNNIDKITDELQDTDIIFICADRREKGDAFVSKLFSIGIYNLLLGDDRNVNPLCEIIKKPKNKREAKQYLNIDASSIVSTSMTTDDEVDEFQMRSILSFYEGIKNQPEKYLETFDRISEQYSRKQLKIIMMTLPKQIRQVILEADRYKYLMSPENVQDTASQGKVATNTVKAQKVKSGGLFSVFKKHKAEENVGTQKPKVELGGVIQAGGQVDLSSNTEEQKQTELLAKAKAEAKAREQAELAAKAKAEEEARHKAQLDAIAAERRNKEAAEAAARAIEKSKKEAELLAKQHLDQMAQRENVIIEVKPNANAPERKEQVIVNRVEEPATPVEPSNNSAASAISQKIINAVKNVNEKIEEIKVEQKSQIPQSTVSEEEKRVKAEQEKLIMEQKRIKEEQAKLEEEKRRLREEQEKLINAQKELRANVVENIPQPHYTNTSTTMQIAPADYKKMVVFVGTNKVGTTFMTNAVAHLMANSKIVTSILDMTRDRSMFYLYNQNDKTLRRRAEECMPKVMDGDDCYLETSNRFLKVYTTLPGTLTDPRRGYKHKAIIETVKSNCNLTIVDADFTTPIDYFDQANEVYLIQDLDLLKMPDATLFLRELKNRGMDMKKIRIIINKYVKTSLSQKQIVQTLSSYSDPSMSFYDSVLPSKVTSYIVPYNLNNYAKYIDSVCNGVLNYKGYSADFIQAIEEIGSAIFPRNSQNTKSSKKLFG